MAHGELTDQKRFEAKLRIYTSVNWAIIDLDGYLFTNFKSRLQNGSRFARPPMASFTNMA